MAKKDSHSTMPANIAGLFMGSAAVFLFLALVSFSAQDPGLTMARHAEQIHNWMGFVGSYMADGLYIVFGLWAFAIPIFLAEYTYRYSVRKSPINWLHIASTLVIMFAVLGLLEIFIGEITLFDAPMKAGGAIGNIIGGALYAYFKRWGSLIA